MNVSLIDGTKPNTVLYHCHDGYFYYFNNGSSYDIIGEGNRTSIYLRCKNLTSRRCHGTAKILIMNEMIQWTNLGQHTCVRDRSFHQALLMRRDIIRASLNEEGPFETPAQVVNRIRERYHIDVAARITVSAMRSAISRARSNLYPRIPATLEDLGNLLVDHPHLSATLGGVDNFYAGMVQGAGTTSLVFVSQRLRRYLARTRTISCDGTFNSRPNVPNSAQVLQIVGVIDHHTIPLVQVLMTGKSQQEYELVLQYLHQLVPRFRPRIVITDFETGMQNAWREVFQCDVSGCYWHFCRAVTLKARQLGLTVFLRNDRVAKSIVRSLLAIPLLPQEYMERGVQVLMTEANRTGRLGVLTTMFDYFIDTWFSVSTFQSLSVYQVAHRTNNCAESANKMLRSKTGPHRPSLWHFLSALRKYEREAFTTQRTLDAGLPIKRPRRVEAINNDQYIANYTRQLFDGRISLRRFLHRASTRVLNVYDFF